MEKKKSAPIWGLFYREFYPNIKGLIACNASGIAFAFVVYLVKLSTEIGNLANLSAEELAQLQLLLPMLAIYFPGFLFMAQVNGSYDAFLFESTVKFRCFTASIPVSEWKFVGVKYLASASVLFLGLLFAILNAAIMCHIFDQKFDRAVVATILMVAIFTSILCVLLYTACYLFRNSTVAVIALLVTAYAIVLGLMGGYIEEIEELATENELVGVQTLIDKISDFSVKLLPFSVPIIIGLLLLGWVLGALLAKRREK